jgi:hypothetical protein
LLAHGRWFSPASSITKTGCHDIAKIFLKVALSTKKLINPYHKNILNGPFYVRVFLISGQFNIWRISEYPVGYWKLLTNIKLCQQSDKDHMKTVLLLLIGEAEINFAQGVELKIM